ncbi:MAG TPA: hypothetical protein VK465_00770, partial [Fibrobacteria bacterium]|nr:hypothetical protein [Fibrobacteria bacterium]
ESRHEPVALDAGTWVLPTPEPAPPAYRESQAMVRTTPPPSADKQAGAAREQDLATRLDMLEAAIEGEKKVEFNYHGPTPRRVTLKPLLLLRHRAPVKLIGIEVDTGHRNEYLVDQVKALRVLE